MASHYPSVVQAPKPGEPLASTAAGLQEKRWINLIWTLPLDVFTYVAALFFFAEGTKYQGLSNPLNGRRLYIPSMPNGCSPFIGVLEQATSPQMGAKE